MSQHTPGILKKAFARAAEWSIGKAGFYPSFAFAFACSRDFKPWHHLDHLARCVAARSTIYQLITLTQYIDDLIDEADPQNVLTADFSRGADGISGFLRDERFVPTRYLNVLQALDRQGVMPLDRSVNYSNLFADLLQERASLQVTTARTRAPHHRAALSENHLQFTELFFAFMFNVVQPDMSTQARSVEAIGAALPQIKRLSRLVQLTDDFTDMLVDLEQEFRASIITPNAVLAAALKTEEDYAQAWHFVRRMEKGPSSYALQELPVPLQAAGFEADRHIQAGISGIDNAVPRQVMSAYWQGIRQNGFYTPAHPAVQTKRRKDMARVQNALALNG